MRHREPRFPLARSRGFLVLALSLALFAGCARREDEATVAADALQARAQALIDSGNVAYRAGDYPLAARRYASATLTKKDDPAAWFGLGMALQKLGRDEDARSAFSYARELASRARAGGEQAEGGD